MDINLPIKKFTWRIENFSTTKERLCSEEFIVDGDKWKIIVTWNNTVDHFSLFLVVANSATLPSGWSKYVRFGMAVIDQIDRKASITKVIGYEFKAEKAWMGFPSLLPLSQLHDPKRGYLVNDACLVEAYVSTNRDIDLISRELIVKTPSPTQISGRRMAIERKETTEEDMKTFFINLESVLLSFNNVAQKEAREALAGLDEVLNTTPVDFYYSDKFSSLRQTFKILSSFDYCSTTITTEQKKELLGMEERLEKLACQAARAMEDKNLFTAKESVKLAVTRNLECSLIRFKQLEQNLAALNEQGKVEKRKEDMLTEQKGIFKISKKMKTELESLATEWEGYEANAKIATEEEKTIDQEWKRMKDFISSLKGKI